MPDLTIKPNLGAGNKVIIQDQAGAAVLTTADSGATLSNSTQDNITRLGTVTTGTIGSGVTFPAGHIIQTVHGIGGNTPATHNGATWTNLETLGTTITVTKGNKVLVFAHSVNWYTSGTANHNGTVRIQLSDGTNQGETNAVLLWTQNFSINTPRMYGTSHSGMLTTASGSGTVVVTAYVQAATESGGTVNYGDANTWSTFGYILQEIQG